MPKIKKTEFASEYCEARLAHAESIDSLYREGFRRIYQTFSSPWLLERWDHPNGSYKLVAYRGGGIYTSENANDSQWIEIIHLVFCEDIVPGLLRAKDWFELTIKTGEPFAALHQYLSSDEIPGTLDQWDEFLGKYDDFVAKFGECTFSLQDGRSRETVFPDTVRRNRGKSVGSVSRKNTRKLR